MLPFLSLEWLLVYKRITWRVLKLLKIIFIFSKFFKDENSTEIFIKITQSYVIIQWHFLQNTSSEFSIRHTPSYISFPIFYQILLKNQTYSKVKRILWWASIYLLARFHYYILLYLFLDICSSVCWF